MAVIIVSGTPGTGKTAVARAIEALGYKCLDIGSIVAEKGLSEGYDRAMKCHIVDTARLNKALTGFIKGSKGKLIVIDGHLSHFLPSRYVDLCIITKCGIKELKKRLEKKGYSKKKVRENLDCEILDICLNEAKENKHNVKTFDTTGKETAQISEEIKKIIKKHL